MTKKYISPEHAIRNVMSKKNDNVEIKEFVDPPWMKQLKEPLAADDKKVPTIPKRDIGKDLNKLRKSPFNVVLDTILGFAFPPPGVVRSPETVTDVKDDPGLAASRNRQAASIQGFSKTVEIPTPTAPVIPPPDKKIETPKEEPVKVPVKAPETVPSVPVPQPAPVEVPAPKKEPVKGPEPVVEPVPETVPSVPGPLPLPIPVPLPGPGTTPGRDNTRKKEIDKKNNDKGKRRFNPPLGFGASTPGQSGTSISGFETPDYLHTAKSRLADKPAKIVKENTADDERRAIENVPRPKSGRNKSMTRNQEIKKKIIDENVKKKSIIKDAVKNSKDKNYSVELNPEYKHEKLSD